MPKKDLPAGGAPQNSPDQGGRASAPQEIGGAATAQVPGDPLPVVGIGASAGGLAALKQFFAAVPEDSGLAYVVVEHLSPEHESHLAELLQPHVKMPVQQVTETVELKPNCVYVIPPGANLDTIDSHLRLSELERQRQERAPIDHFFRTLAETHASSAIAIVLTGAGSDGTLGLKAIKGCGGLTVVQDPSEAEFDGMPQSAIATGMIDLVLPLAKMPEALLQYISIEPDLPPADEDEALREEERRLLDKLFVQIRARTGRDVSRYKRSTILRRIQRRMQLRQVAKFGDYVDLVCNDRDEVGVLADDLLITVTNFFRDPEIFATLEKAVIPELFDGKGENDEIRVWSVGCATGEEAYSLAILLLEEATRRQTACRIQVFASDLHERSLQRAREGRYPGDVETDVPPRRLKRYFIKENGGYRVRKEVRELVVFAPHNLIGDPPFSRLDLIACRNLLIYLQREVQKDVVDLFHYALRPEGLLLLGTSETVETHDLFQLQGKKSCLYRKRNVSGPEPRLPVFPQLHPRIREAPDRAHSTAQPMPYGMLHQWMVERYAPPSALVSQDNKVVHLSEHAGRFLLTPGGEPTMNIVKLARPELQLELRAVLQEARSREAAVVESRPVLVRFNGESGYVVIHARASQEPRHAGFVLVIFEERQSLAAAQTQNGEAPQQSAPPLDDVERRRIVALETELVETRQRLQAIIEEYEISQEEMKASNEEMQSTNEELRSTLEELETSREELQSMNEELQTVNQENRHKVEELSQMSADLQNLMGATDIATLFLDHDLRIVRFTPRISELFNVRMFDRGRPLSDLTHRLGYDELHDDAVSALETLIPVEREVKDERQRWYLTRVVPYRSTDDRILGVVITFVDITSRKRAEQELRDSEERFRVLVDAAAQDVWEADSEGNAAIIGAARAFDPGGSPRLGKTFNCLEVVHPEDRPIAERAWRDAVANAHPVNMEVRLRDPQDDWRWTNVRAAPVCDAAGRVLKWVGMNIDVTERRIAEAALSAKEQEFRSLVEQVKDYAIFMIDPQGRGSSWNEGVKRVLGFDEVEFVGCDVAETIFTPEDIAQGVPQAELALAAETGHASNDRWMRRKDGARFWAAGITTALRNDDGSLLGYMKVMRDQTGQKTLEEELRRIAAALSEANHRKDEFLATLAHELRNPLAPIRSGLELIAMDREDAQSFEEIRAMMQRQTEQLVALVDDLMDISRITRGTFELRKRPVRVSEVVQNAVDAARPVIDDAKHRLQVDLRGEDCTLYADPNRLAQILANLLNNAAKYTAPGGEISLSAEPAGAEFAFAVQDSGYGIPADKLGKIFEMFSQLDSRPQQQQYSGLGIGLTLAKQLVEMHEGRIEVQSDGVDKGSRFTVYVPLGEAELSESSPAAPRANAAASRRLRILVVDDNGDAAKMLSTLVKRMGHDVRTAGDGLQAVDVAARFQPHLVLMDLGMPKMNGYEAARHIRLQTWGQEMKLVALTGWGQESDRERARDAGFDEHLVKPAEPGALKAIFEMHFGGVECDGG